MYKEGFVKNKYLDFYLYAGYENDYVHRVYKKFGGTFDPQLATWLINNVKPGWVVYDIGANMFEFTEISARMSGPNGRVFSFEPQINLINKYEEARELNNYDDVSDITIFNFGLGSFNGTKKFMTNIKNLGGSTFEEKFYNYANYVQEKQIWEISEIDIRRADSIGLPEIVPDLIKVDIEGGEEEFWKGSPEFIKNSKNIIMEIGRYTEDWLIEEVSKNRIMFDISSGKPLNLSNTRGEFQRDVLFTKGGQD